MTDLYSYLSVILGLSTFLWSIYLLLFKPKAEELSIMTHIRKRALILVTIILFGFAIMVVRLLDLTLINHNKLAMGQYSRESAEPLQRGLIWDKNMREMAVDIDAYSLYVIPSKIKDASRLSDQLAPILKMSSKELTRTLHSQNDDFVWLKKRVDIQEFYIIKEMKDKMDFEELGFIKEYKRYYPRGQTASHILGFTNSNEGVAGLELLYNEQLTHKIQSYSIGTDADNTRGPGTVEKIFSGNNLLLTIDEGIQHIVEIELSSALSKWKAKAAVAIMMNPMTGEIIALANMPSYDPNFTDTSLLYAMHNRAVDDLLEPTSMMTSLVAAGAINEGMLRPDDKFDVSKGYIVVGDMTIRDNIKHDILTVRDIIQKSSTIGAVQIGQRLGEDKCYKVARDFGFGAKTGIDIPGELDGTLHRDDDASISVAALSRGQGLAVTPLQLLNAYVAIANGGVLMTPYIVSSIFSPDGSVVKQISPTIKRSVISKATSDVVKDTLTTIVDERGTATKVYIRGNLVVGKSSTAHIIGQKTNRYSNNRDANSFVGIIPADNPKFALIVVVYNPRGATYGEEVTLPVFKRIIERTYTYLDNWR